MNRYLEALRALLTPTREGDTHTLMRVDEKVDGIQRRLDRVRGEIDEILGDLSAARGGDAQAMNRALVALLDISRSAGASGPMQSSLAKVTADAGFLQAIFETGLLTPVDK